MKKIVGLLLVVMAFQMNAQSNTELLKHYEKFYEQMKAQGDVQGVVDALTHLNILDPSIARRDTLAVLYMNEGRHVQALNTLGVVERNSEDSDMAVEVKAVCLQALNQPKRSIENYEELFKRSPNVLIAYELADLKAQTGDLTGANVNISYGIANSGENVMRTFYEMQQPYRVPAKAAFLYLKALVKYKENPEVNSASALATLDEALKLAPNFNLAALSKDAINAQKNTPKKEN